MSKQLCCPICGEPTAKSWGNYNQFGLCKEHSKMEKNGEIVQCEECGRWHEIFEKCECQKLTCIICNEPSNGKHFCYSCWKQYKDKSIDIRFKNLKFEKVLDNYGNKTVPCKSGIKVRSRAEKIICDFLFDHNIKNVYEKEIPYNEYGKEKTLKPDFYLPDYFKNGLIVEYNELQNEEYLNSKNYVLKAYKKLGIDVIVLTKEDIDNDLRRLKSKLNIVI